MTGWPLAMSRSVAVYSVGGWIAGSELPSGRWSRQRESLPHARRALRPRPHARAVRRECWGIVRLLIGASAVAAVLTVLAYMIAPASFWETVIDLPRFIREVQGYPAALSLASISVLGHYGVGDEASFLRATWPFVHPVGTGHYFVLPMTLSIASIFAAARRGADRRESVFWVLTILFAAAVIVPISRGSWIAAVIAAVISRRLPTYVDHAGWCRAVALFFSSFRPSVTPSPPRRVGQTRQLLAMGRRW